MDDHQYLTYGIYTKQLELEHDIKNELTNGFQCLINETSLNDVLKALGDNKVDFILIGNNEMVMLPLLKRDFPHLKIVVITEDIDADKVGFAIGNGAASILPYPLTTLKEQLQKVMVEGYYFPINIMEKFITSYKKINDSNTEMEQKEYRKPLHLLTRRECEVLQLLAEGKSNREVGQILYISEKTVKNHVSNILMKLKVKDRTKAVLLAIKKSWVYVS
ncbi:response regulator transcription factor [Lottiidibacillus patelloidae]|nr:response regulator transcription factor [Lottiidibacillus patelloidae]